jgi:hypothetical protein
MMRPVRALKRVVLGLIALGIAFALLEGAASLAYVVYWARMHFWAPIPERSHTRYDPTLGWAAIPGSVSRNVYGPGLDVTANTRGFRGAKEYGDSIPDGFVRVIAAGDSFTLGYGVGDADAWPAQLERLCPRIEAPNMGQSGYGIDQNYLWYERDAAELAHDVVVLAFIDHDLGRPGADAMLGYGKPLLRARGDALELTNVPVPRTGYWLPVLTQNAASLEQLRLLELPRALIAHFRPQPPPTSQVLAQAELDRVNELALRTLDRLARKRGAKLVLVHLPHLEPDRPAVLSRLSEGDAAVIARVAARDVPFFDLRSEFEAVPDPDRRALFQAATLTRGAAGHYSAAGNEFVARTMARRLIALGLVPNGVCAAP